MKKFFGDLDAFQAAVALDLAFIGVVLDAPEPAVSQKRRDRAVDCRHHGVVQNLRLAVETQPHMPVRIAITDEKPAIDGARVEELSNEQSNGVA